jgi:hypothetical protein
VDRRERERERERKKRIGDITKLKPDARQTEKREEKTRDISSAS